MAFDVPQEHPRYRVTMPVDVVHADGSVSVQCLDDISLGGVFVRTAAPAPLGGFVRLRITIDDVEVAVVGRVVHFLDEQTAARKARPPGMGVQFDGLAPDADDRIRRFIHRLALQERRTHDVERMRAPLAEVLAAADHLADRIASLDGFAALGLQRTARADEVVAATTRLLRLFTGAYAHARGSERRRLERVAAALRLLEQDLLGRVAVPAPIDLPRGEPVRSDRP